MTQCFQIAQNVANYDNGQIIKLCVPWENLSLLILQVLNISGNNVPLLGRRHFARLGLTNLQRIAASRCGLVQIDSLAFIGLTNLVELDLALNELIEVTFHFKELDFFSFCDFWDTFILTWDLERGFHSR